MLFRSLGYWWTREPLVIGKFAVLGSTCKTIQGLEKITSINQPTRKTSNSNMENKSDFSQIKILDPFGGSGNLIYEAKKLGFDCNVSDYNPVSFILLKSVFEYPVKYGEKLALDIEKLGQKIIQKTKQDLEIFFDSDDTPQAFLWYWCIICPYCGQRFPLSNNMWLSRKKNIGFKIIPQPNLDFHLEITHNISEHEAERFTQKGGKAICIKCTNTIDYETITSQIKQKNDLHLGIIKTESKTHPYRVAVDKDQESYAQATRYFQNISHDLESLIPNEQIKIGRAHV